MVKLDNFPVLVLKKLEKPNFAEKNLKIPEKTIWP
jgi:hypothetical protein